MPTYSSKVLNGVRDSGTLVTGGTGSRCWGADVSSSRRVLHPGAEELKFLAGR
jgi:hypothetical protein